MLGSYAQEPADTIKNTRDREKGLHFGVARDSLDWLVNRPRDNWYFSPRVGLQEYYGNGIQPHRWNDITPVFQLGIGKWLIPDVAFELSVTGAKANSQSRYGRNPYVDFSKVETHPDEDGVMRYEYQSFFFNYMCVDGAAALDWTNFFKGYYDGMQKRYHFITMVGLGFNMGWGKVRNARLYESNGGDYMGKARNFELTGMFAINNSIRLTESMDLNIILRDAVTRGSFDDYYGAEDHMNPRLYDRHRFDNIFSVMVGLTFNLRGEKNIKARQEFIEGNTYIVNQNQGDGNNNGNNNANDNNGNGNGAPATDTALVNAIREANKILQRRDSVLNSVLEQISKNNNQPDNANAKTNLPAQIISQIDDRQLKAAYVKYELNKAIVTESDIEIVRNMAEYIKNDSSNMKYMLIGSADSRTGTVQINQRLSEKRCKAVYDLMVNRFGVDPKRLVMKALGGIDDYEPYELNRLCIIVGEDPELMKLIDLKRK
jgi:outer membrane protein OmpA-like peptidoglycan-associated protein